MEFYLHAMQEIDGNMRRLVTQGLFEKRLVRPGAVIVTISDQRRRNIRRTFGSERARFRDIESCRSRHVRNRHQRHARSAVMRLVL